MLDLVSTENCIFGNSDPKVVAVVGNALQLLLMVILLFVQLCISLCLSDGTLTASGGMFISSTPFYSKKNQDYAELASRIGYSPLSTPLRISYLITTVLPPFHHPSYVRSNIPVPAPRRIINHPLRPLHHFNNPHDIPDPPPNTVLLPLRTTPLPSPE